MRVPSVFSVKLRLCIIEWQKKEKNDRKRGLHTKSKKGVREGGGKGKGGSVDSAPLDH